MEISGPLASIKRSLSVGLRGRGRLALGSPQSHVRAIQQLGLQEVACYWFRPNFETCTKIIPLHERAALLHALAPRQGSNSLQARLQTYGRRWLVEKLSSSGALEFMIPCLGIVAR
ncbi:MAG: hypothetical protein DCC55_05195 [Chloroflexi bacterium]|nr:MAG: hypothetical protein DCC55_05195 [Chloroflexota bacterium]